MAQTGRGKGGAVDIAAISGVSRPGDVETGLIGFRNVDDLVLSWRDGRALLSASRWHETKWSQRVRLLQAALGAFSCIPKSDSAELHWVFSGKTVRHADAADLLDRWIQQRAPP